MAITDLHVSTLHAYQVAGPTDLNISNLKAYVVTTSGSSGYVDAVYGSDASAPGGAQAAGIRTVDQVQDGLLALMPDGWASTHDPDTYLGANLRPVAAEIALIESSVFSMLTEIDPRQAPHLLPDWERMLGPDPCQVSAQITSIAARGSMAFQRLTNAGTICAGYFERYAASIGETIAITEFIATECGVSQCGEELSPQPNQCCIQVTLGATDVVEAICGETTCGEPLGSFRGSVMECVIRQGVPLHVTPYFFYTS